VALIPRAFWSIGLAAAVAWPLGVRAACTQDPELGLVCRPAGPVAVGLVGSTSDTGLRRTIALAVTEELLEDEASETGGGSGDGPPFDVSVSLLYGNKDYDGENLTGPTGGLSGNVQGVTGFTSDTWGGVLGVTLRGTQYFAGAAIDYSEENADFQDNAGSRDTEELGVQLYGTYYPLADRRLFLTGVARYAGMDIETERTFPIFDPATEVQTGRLNTARGSTDGLNYGLYGGAGYSWPLQEQTLLTLSGWLSWQRNEIDGYSETGALPQSRDGESANLRYDDDKYSTLDGALTATLLHEVPIPNGRLLPSASLSYVHELESDTRTINAELIDLDPNLVNKIDDKFIRFQTNEADPDYFRIDASLTAQLNQGTTLYAAYTGTLDHDWRDESFFSIGLSQTF